MFMWTLQLRLCSSFFLSGQFAYFLGIFPFLDRSSCCSDFVQECYSRCCCFTVYISHEELHTTNAHMNGSVLYREKTAGITIMNLDTIDFFHIFKFVS